MYIIVFLFTHAFIRFYLKKGYKWVIWTDLDVLFMTNGSLLDEWLKKAGPNHHIALVNECAQNDNIKARGGVRSGFMAVRNTLKGLEFLDAWTQSFKQFKNDWNPEQIALEVMTAEAPWKEFSYVADFSLIHSYPMCYDRDVVKAISIHFPAHLKNDVGRYFEKLPKLVDPLLITANEHY